eukprot:CAMPEP_0170506138 /NCGR_PEP_ID=MMETSP0208-20121228/53780_1 /TAXON_ID=197538 /ORGANISM="Strombidium inclinatum, Strain S3" /LENGTH=41 /DNA_ID= /DNA_START= /DNA_END= /DNA_ORIENTATION=
MKASSSASLGVWEIKSLKECSPAGSPSRWLNPSKLFSPWVQ